MPPSELSMIASFQSRENVICRGQHGKKKRKHNEAIRKNNEWAFLVNKERV